MDDTPGVLLINVAGYVNAAWFLWIAVLYEVAATIFVNNNFKISGDRKGLTRSAILLVLFMVIHAVGNLHVFMGPDDFNGYGYFYVRLYWTGFGLPANIVEEYILLSVLLHVLVGLKRTYDMKLTMGVKSGHLNLAISGLMLLTFMTIHLFQFRFGDTEQFGPYMIRPPPFLINFVGIFQLRLFWSEDTEVVAVPVRDIYALEFQLFSNQVWSAHQERRENWLRDHGGARLDLHLFPSILHDYAGSQGTRRGCATISARPPHWTAHRGVSSFEALDVKHGSCGCVVGRM